VRTLMVNVLLMMVQVIPLVAGVQKRPTEAEGEGLLGPVKAVTTRTEVSNPEPPLPTKWMPGAIVYPVWCAVCEFDEHGNRVVWSGSEGNNSYAETVRNVYDDAGNLRERTYRDGKGEVIRYVASGPHGMTEMKTYRGGELVNVQTIDYQDGGKTKLILIADGKGMQTGRTKQRLGDDGQIIEAWNYGKKNEFLSHYTNVADPETGTLILTEFNEDGKVRLTWTARDHNIVSFWEEPSATPQPGSRACFELGPRKSKCEWYSRDGSFTQTTAEFLDDAKHFPAHTEFRDEHQQIQMTGDYEYDFDGHGNWVRRAVYVWTSGTMGRQLIREQRRTVTYWK